jgi:hypothetical protein
MIRGRGPDWLNGKEVLHDRVVMTYKQGERVQEEEQRRKRELTNLHFEQGALPLEPSF